MAALWLRNDAGRIRAYALAALVALGALGWMHQPDAQAVPRAHTTRLPCTVLDVGQTQGESTSYTCVTDSGPVLAVAGSGSAPAVGTRVLLRGRLEPFDAPRNPGEPDERLIERERGVDLRLSSAHVLATLPPIAPTLQVRIALVHAWALKQLRARLDEPYASILAGELWGERGSLPPELRAEFQETGTVHVLVTAGLHLGVVAAVVLWLLRLCTTPRALSCALAIAIVWAYAVFSGLHLPSARAATMISLGLVAYGIGAAPSSWRAYVCAAAAVVFFRPGALQSASFALSFSCVGSILLFAEPIRELLESFALPDRVKEALTLTIATQIGTWPLTASIFLLFSPYAILANLLVVPVVGFTMILGAMQLVTTSAPLIAQLAANANSWLLAWIVAAVHTISGLPYAAVPITPPQAWTIVCYDACAIAGISLWKRDGRTAALVSFLIGVLLVISPPVFPDRHLRITVLDVGQADAIVIQTPAGYTLLVDAGGRLESGHGSESTAEQAGQRIVVPFLHRIGVTHIDAIILSHPHGDHVGAAAPILRDGFGVSELGDSGQQYGGYAYNDAIQTARADGVPIVYPRAGMVWRTEDGVTLTFIGPALPFIESNNTINDNSVAFILQYKRFRMLFTGDAGDAAEERFLNEGIDLHADVLKVGHHGSAYSSSSAFVSAVHPQYAIVSVGRHNMFGHPALSTLKTLQVFDARIYRTDDDGAVTVTTDGRAEAVSTMLPYR